MEDKKELNLQKIEINPEILKFISLNSKIQRSDLRVYLFLASVQKPIYQKELSKLAEDHWNKLKKELFHDDPTIKRVNFNSDTICRSVKNLMEFHLVKVIMKKGQHKFIVIENDFKEIQKLIKDDFKERSNFK